MLLLCCFWHFSYLFVMFVNSFLSPLIFMLQSSYFIRFLPSFSLFWLNKNLLLLLLVLFFFFFRMAVIECRNLGNCSASWWFLRQGSSNRRLHLEASERGMMWGCAEGFDLSHRRRMQMLQLRFCGGTTLFWRIQSEYGSSWPKLFFGGCSREEIERGLG